MRKLCRMLGLGLLALHPRRRPPVEVVVEPVPYRPRLNRPRRELLLTEHGRRIGDPNHGGISRRPIVTAYRQDALRCAELDGNRARLIAGGGIVAGSDPANELAETVAKFRPMRMALDPGSAL